MPEISTYLEEKLATLECDHTPTPPPEYCVNLPFGIKLCTGRASAFFFEGREKQLLSFVGLLQPMLTPLLLILILASLVKALIDCVNSVVDAVSSLSPQPIIECLEKLAKILPTLMHFIPPLNYIRTLVDIVRIIIALLDTLIESIELTIQNALSLVQFDLKVELLPELGQYRFCLDSEIDTQYQQIAAALRTIGPLFGILGTFLDLLSIGPLKKFVKPMKDIVDVLADVEAGDINSGFLETLRDMQRVLSDLEKALAPFGGG